MTTDGLTWDDDQWYHIAVSYDSNTADPNDSIVTFYQTPLGLSAPVVAGTLTSQPDIEPLTAGGTLRLGGFDGMDTRSFGGYIDELRYYNAVLTSFNLAIPEPATISLLGLGAICLVGYRCRKKRRAAHP